MYVYVSFNNNNKVPTAGWCWIFPSLLPSLYYWLVSTDKMRFCIDCYSLSYHHANCCRTSPAHIHVFFLYPCVFLCYVMFLLSLALSIQSSPPPSWLDRSIGWHFYFCAFPFLSRLWKNTLLYYHFLLNGNTIIQMETGEWSDRMQCMLPSSSSTDRQLDASIRSL